MNGLALCAGAGGLELGIKLAVGGAYRCVGYVERDGYATAILVARMADQALDLAPVWDDLATFDGRPWRGAVDLISAGFPCQPFSLAGRRAGTADARWLWPDIARIVREVRPRYIFLENVPELVRHGLPSILGDLAALGFAAEWDLFSAAEAGAPHIRRRFFLLADALGVGQRESPNEAHALPAGRASRSEFGCRSSVNVADAECWGRSERLCPSGETNPGSEQAGATDSCSANVGHSDRGTVPRSEWGPQAGDGPRSSSEAVAITERGGRRAEAEQPAAQRDRGGFLFPPARDDDAGWRALLACDPSLEPAVRRDAPWLAYRLDRVRTVGNGVVPVVAAVAFLSLLDRLRDIS